METARIQPVRDSTSRAECGRSSETLGAILLDEQSLPQTAVTLLDPGDQTNSCGEPVLVSLVASDVGGAAASFEQALSAQRIWQDLRTEHDIQASHYSVVRFVAKLPQAEELPFRGHAVWY